MSRYCASECGCSGSRGVCGIRCDRGCCPVLERAERYVLYTQLEDYTVTSVRGGEGLYGREAKCLAKVQGEKNIRWT